MSDTYLIDEVRAVRHLIAEKCGNDLEKIARHAQEAADRLGFKSAEAI